MDATTSKSFHDSSTPASTFDAISSSSQSNTSTYAVIVDRLSYYVPKRAEPILNNISFTAKPGCVTAILGASGSGKTTLLNYMAGRLKPSRYSRITGSVFCVNTTSSSNHNTPTTQIPSLSTDISAVTLSYVLSRETFSLGLTIYEVLKNAADLLFPKLKESEREDKVNENLHSVELWECKNQCVGTRREHGLSNEQAKRLSLAIALLSEPPVVILDEPTTGLDAHLSCKIIQLMKCLAEKDKRCFICSIHQPAMHTFQLFDEVIFLDRGKLVYMGSPQQTKFYFEQHSPITCPPTWNAVDFAIETIGARALMESHDMPTRISGSTSKTLNNSVLSSDMYLQTTTGKDQGIENHVLNKKNDETVLTLETIYQKSDYGVNQRITIDQYSTTKKHLFLCESIKTSWIPFHMWLWQLLCLIKRCFLAQMRDKVTVILLLIAAIVQGFLLGGLYWDFPSQVDNTTVFDISEILLNSKLNSTAIIDVFGIDGKLGLKPLFDAIDYGVNNKGRSLFDTTALNDTFWTLIEVIEDTFWNEFNVTNYNYPDFSYLRYLHPFENNINIKNRQPLNTSLPLIPSTVARGLGDVLKGLEFFHFFCEHHPWETRLAPCLAYGFQDNFCMFLSCAATAYGDVLGNLAHAGTTILSTYGINIPEFNSSSIDKLLEACKTLPHSESTPEHHRLLMTDDDDSDTRRQQHQSKEPLKLHQIAPLYNNNNTLRLLLASSYEEQQKVPLFNELYPKDWLYTIERFLNTIRSQHLATSILGIEGRKFFQYLIGFFERLYEAPHPLIIKFHKPIEEIGRTLKVYVLETLNTILTMFNLSGVVFFISLFLGFGSYDVLLAFPAERILFNRETVKGLYTPSAYYSAKMIADLPFQMLPSTVMAITMYLTVGLYKLGSDNPLITFLQYWGVCLLVTFCAYSFGYMVSSIASRLEITLLIAPIFLMIWLCISGFFLRDSDLPGWIIWLRYLAFYRWGFFAHESILFPPGRFFGSLPNEIALDFCGIVERRVWFSCVMLLVCSVLYRTVGFLGLKFLHRHIGLES